MEPANENKPAPLKRNKRDVLLAIVEEIAADCGPGAGVELRKRFETELLPVLTLSTQAGEVISEEEFQSNLAQMRKEMPQFRAYLLQNFSSKNLPGGAWNN